MFLMNNKRINRHIAVPEEDLEIVYQQIHKNKEEIELFYARNKMKFPPILQSRHIVFQHILPYYAQNSTQDNQKNQIQSPQHSENPGQKKNGSRKWIEKRPSICKIVFSKAKNNKNAQIETRNANSHEPNANAIKTISHTPRKYYLSEEKAKDLTFLNRPAIKNTTIQHFMQHLTQPRSSDKKNTFILTKSYDISNTHHKHPQPLSINRISTHNPETVLFNTFQDQKMNMGRERETWRKGQQGKSPKNEGNNGEDGHIFRRRQASHRKEGGYFEPWQQDSFIQDDYFTELKK